MIENNNIFKKILGKNIKTFRQVKGWEQVELGEKLGYESSGAISLIESGLRGMDKEKIFRAAKVFGIDVVFLLSDHEHTPREAKQIISFYNYIHRETPSIHTDSIESLLALAEKE